MKTEMKYSAQNISKNYDTSMLSEKLWKLEYNFMTSSWCVVWFYPFYPFLSFCILMWILDFNKLSKHVCLKPQKVEIFKVKQPIGKLNTY